MGIVIIGAVFVDIKGYPEDVYIPAGRNVGRVEQVHGGVGRNIAEDIANVELRPTFVSVVDESGIGADVVRKLADHKVNTDYIRAVPDGMGTWLAVFENDGDVVASISKRPDLMPIADILDQHGDEIFAEADSIVVELDMDKESIKRVFKLAQKYRKKIYAAVANISIAAERRDFLQSVDCFVCNQQEVGLLFSDDYSDLNAAQLELLLREKVVLARIPAMIVTMGDQGAVYADMQGNSGFCPARRVKVKDTTGAGDAFCAGVAIGLTYGKDMQQSCEIGAHLAASVITTSESVCPRFLPRELGLDMDVADEK
jgi:pseudouridine kinase